MAGNGDCVAFYGLREPPFSGSPDRRFLYLGRSSSTACDQMVQAIRRHEGIVVVVGDSGIGKTAVCRAVIEDILAPEHVSIVVDPLLSVGDLLRHLLDDFTRAGADASGSLNTTPHDLIVHLDRFLTALPPKNLAVLLIDDAHQLSAEVLAWLRVLSNLEDERGKKLQIVLVGQPSIEALLERPDVQHLNQRIARRCRIVSMSAAEVERYVAYRLEIARSGPAGQKAEKTEKAETAGEEDDAPALRIEVSDETLAPFSKAAVRTLAIVSGGTPRTINLIADRALSVGFEQQQRHIMPAAIRAASSSLGVPVPIRARLSRQAANAAVAAVALVAAIAALRAWPLPLPTFAAKSTVRTASVETPTVSPTPTPRTQAAGQDAPSTGAEPLPRGDAYLLVVASFRVEQNAEHFAKTLTDQSLPAFVQPGAPGGWFAVVIGPYASADEANELKARLAGQSGLTNVRLRVERP